MLLDPRVQVKGAMSLTMHGDQPWLHKRFSHLRKRTSWQLLWIVFMVALGLPSATMGQQAPAPVSSNASAQSPSSPNVIAFAQYQGSTSSLGMVMSLTADLGYQFSDRFAAEIGVPLLLVRSPFSPVVNHDWYWQAAIGEPYLDIRYMRPYHKVKLTSIATVTFPIANMNRIFGTSRFGADLFNHVQETFGDLTPFLNVGVSNGAVNRFVMPRPYTEARPYQSLGFLSDYEGGLEFKRHKGILQNFGLGGSLYDLLPVGPQKVFSRFVLPYSSLAGDGHHNRFFDSTFETVGPSTIARDNGYSGWLDITRWHPIDLQLGYTHSVHYVLDTYTVTLTFDAGALAKKLMGY